MSLRVIVVDDSRVMRQIVIRTLRQAGYGDWEVTEASNGAEALEVVLAQQPDLVLSDWNMPEMSGIDLLRRLTVAAPDVPLGFVTSEGLAADAGARRPRGRAVPHRQTLHARRLPLDHRPLPRMSTTPIPPLKEVRDLLTMLVGRDCEVSVADESVTPATEPGVVVGVYVTQFLRGEALVALDTTLAAALGGAIALIPARTALAAVGPGPLPEHLLENTSEVLNVLSSLFNVGNAPHQRLDTVHDSGTGPLPADVAGWLRSYGPRLDVAVDVQGYATGLLSIVLR